jgi:hypothetical protein
MNEIYLEQHLARGSFGTCIKAEKLTPIIIGGKLWTESELIQIRDRIAMAFRLMRRRRSSQQINLGLSKLAVKTEAEILRETRKPLLRSDLICLS